MQQHAKHATIKKGIKAFFQIDYGWKTVAERETTQMCLFN